MKVLKCRTISKDGPFLAEMEVTIDRPVNVVCKVVRKKADGSLFISMPSEKYTNKNGETKYKNLAWFDNKDIQDLVNKELIQEYNSLQNNQQDSNVPF